MYTEKENIEVVDLENLDDFIPAPSSDSVITTEGTEKKNVLSNESNTDIEFDDDFIPTEDDEEVIGTENPKTVPTATTNIFKKLIEQELIKPFEDEKPTEEYTEEDWEELFKANLEEKEKEIKEKTEKEFFEALPDELKYAATYLANGGTDIKGLLKALSQTEEAKSLDVNNPAHQEHIVRNYLYAKNFGDGNKDLIEEQIEEWVEAGTINKKAIQFKPILDQMQDQVVQSKIKQQEQIKEQQQIKKEAYLKNVHETLKPAELNGVKLDSKRQNMLWNEMTTTKYQSMTGRPTNLLGKLLEDYQFGEKPRYDLIAEALWLLADPDDYKAKIQQKAVNTTVDDTVRKLKTEEGRKNITSHIDDIVPDKTRRSIPRQQRNIFSNQQ